MVLRLLKKLLPLAIVVLAFLTISRFLTEQTIIDVQAEIKSIGTGAIIQALSLAALNYIVLTFYDTLGLKMLGHKVSYKFVAMASFISYALSQSLGFPLLTGGGIRYRFYSSKNIPARDIAKLILFVGAMFWSGLLVLLAMLLCFFPNLLGSFLTINLTYLRLAGALILTAPIAYIAITRYFKFPDITVPLQKVLKDEVLASSLSDKRIESSGKWGGYTFPALSLKIPKVKWLIPGIMISALDWCLAAAVLYSLLPTPHDIPFVLVLGAFLIAQFSGVISHVPGGLGVFESVMIFALSDQYRRSAALGALVLYRIIYYIIPLALGLAALLIFELSSSRQRLLLISAQTLKNMKLLRSLVPSALTALVFFAGCWLLFSGALPILPRRLAWINMLMPTIVIEISHFVNSVIGIMLLVFSWSIARRRKEAYIMVVGCLSIGILTAILKGFDLEEAIVLFIVLLVTFSARKEFYRHGTLLTRPSIDQVIGLSVVIIATIGVVLFVHSHTAYSNDLWWKFELEAQAPRVLRSLLGIMVSLIIFGFYFLFRARPPKLNLPTQEQLEKILPSIQKSSNCEGNLALLGDKYLLQINGTDGFIMYQVVGRYWIAMGDPIAASQNAKEQLIWSFRELCDYYDGICVFYETSASNLPIYLEVGLRPLRIGEFATINVKAFSILGSSNKKFRSILRKFETDNYKFEIVPREQIPALLPSLREISDQWLNKMNAKEKGFSLGFFDENYLLHFPMAVVRYGDEILAFANILTTEIRTEFTIDLMRHRATMPNGLMDFLFINLILWGQTEGYETFSLGMAPLSGFESRPLAPITHKIAAFIYEHGNRLYNFAGLREYKEKFRPSWEPRYIMYSNSFVLPQILKNLTMLISRRGGV